MNQEESGGSECCQKEAQMAAGLRTVGVRGVVKGREKLTWIQTSGVHPSGWDSSPKSLHVIKSCHLQSHEKIFLPDSNL